MSPVQRFRSIAYRPAFFMALAAIVAVLIYFTTVNTIGLLDVKAKETHLAQAQAALAQREAAQAVAEEQRTRDASCGFYGIIAGIPLPPNVTSLGRGIHDQSIHATTVLGCPQTGK